MSAISPETQGKPQVIVAGYGLPGRLAVQKLVARRIPYCVIEMNEKTVERCALIGAHIIFGDCADPKILEQAGIQTANLILIAVPDDLAALKATHEARALNPTIKIITRTRYVSSGMEAKVAGADEVIVAEQLVAEEFSRKV